MFKNRTKITQSNENNSDWRESPCWTSIRFDHIIDVIKRSERLIEWMNSECRLDAIHDKRHLAHDIGFWCCSNRAIDQSNHRLRHWLCHQHKTFRISCAFRQIKKYRNRDSFDSLHLFLLHRQQPRPNFTAASSDEHPMCTILIVSCKMHD